MLWAACCLGFFGFLRAGEFTVDSIKRFDPSCHLTPADVSVDSREAPQIVWVVIKQSKTDPFRRGGMISLGKSGNDLCPVSAVLAYLSRRGSSQGSLLSSATTLPCHASAECRICGSLCRSSVLTAICTLAAVFALERRLQLQPQG